MYNYLKNKIFPSFLFILIIISLLLVGNSLTEFFTKGDYAKLEEEKYIILNEDYKCIDCNVIIIGIDTLRADHLGYNGYYRNTSPNIDEFSNEGVVFKNTFSQAPSTLPSFATIFTSLYPIMHKAQIENGPVALSNESKTIAEILKENGYYNIAYTGGGQVAKEFGLGQGFNIYEGNVCYNYITAPLIKKGVIADLKCLEDSIEIVMHNINLNKDRKFFLFFHNYVTHYPHVLSTNKYSIFTDYNNIREEYSNIITDPLVVKNKLVEDINNGKIKMNNELKDYIIGRYDDTIYYMDDWIGYLLEEIKKSDIMDNTIIIFLGDHGEEFTEHGMIGLHSHTLYDELLHVPLIIKYPKSKPKVIDQQVRLIDVMPTILDILNISIKEELQGETLIPIIQGKDKKLPVFSSLEYTSEGQPLKISIRKDSFKLIYDLKYKRTELFDLSKDKNELNNVASKHKAKANELKKELLEWYENNKNYNMEKEKIHDATLLELKSLGYIN
ncbi:sulfatase [Candidatus Woesearchaeota archaeon]|nr:sulfatase [Candidatus Woesearchaeota archaeon]